MRWHRRPPRGTIRPVHFYSAPGKSSKYYDQHMYCLFVCLFVCLSVCPLVYLKKHVQFSPNFLIHVTYGRGITIRYVLPVLWVTSWKHLKHEIGQSQRAQRAVGFVQFTGWRHRGRSLPSMNASRSMFELLRVFAILVSGRNDEFCIRADLVTRPADNLPAEKRRWV